MKVFVFMVALLAPSLAFAQWDNDNSSGGLQYNNGMPYTNGVPNYQQQATPDWGWNARPPEIWTPAPFAECVYNCN